MRWPVVPICKRQRRDVNERDLIEEGLFRKCNIYKGGGGYDEFSKIYNRRFGKVPNPEQFVVQLRGCPLRCPYCYVTEDGIWGKAVEITTVDLLDSYDRSGLEVFHLMGGAPALYLEHWRKIASHPKIFHSDFLLVEKKYRLEWLKNLPGLFAVSLKNFDVDFKMLWNNFDTVLESGVEFYVTFTGKPVLKNSVTKRYGKKVLKDSFVIPVVKYKATIF